MIKKDRKVKNANNKNDFENVEKEIFFFVNYI